MKSRRSQQNFGAGGARQQLISIIALALLLVALADITQPSASLCGDLDRISANH
jgi:hypothetical protein